MPGVHESFIVIPGKLLKFTNKSTWLPFTLTEEGEEQSMDKKTTQEHWHDRERGK